MLVCKKMVGICGEIMYATHDVIIQFIDVYHVNNVLYNQLTINTF